MAKEIINPLILSIESSQSTCGICISSDKNLLAEYTIYQANQHDKLLAELIRRILNDLSINPERLDAVAISSGPGSFTGLRIGASIAKALCFDGKIKLIPVPTLTAIAYSYINTYKIDDHEKIVSVVPSHKKFVYYQVFNKTLTPESDITFDEIQNLKSLESPETIIISPLKDIEIFHSYQLIQLTPRIIAEYAYTKYQTIEFTDSEKFLPLYVQEFVPKISKK